MATNLLPVQPLGVTVFVRRSSDNVRRKTSTVASAGSNNSWWSPLFGWSSDGADYIDSDNNEDMMKSKNQKTKNTKFAPGCFTEEKARQLRMLTMGTETFHEVMYHSAIASRLATDAPRRSPQ